MKKIFVLLILGLFLSGCATYKFNYGEKPYDKGYVISRDDYTILEYTIGRDNSVPDLKLAEGRFNRRRKIVEHYYKKIGRIENNFKKNVWGQFSLFLGVLGGVFHFPFFAISDYKYEHNPEYRERIDKLDEERDAREQARIKKLKDKLNTYIQQDLAKESF
ncbi:MAG: hypothetical protein ISS45_13155 [Candidatus Omnitrophica bacterium]|nr:hypothetical protein [Candidatus Omnitrophota bacterium]